VLFEEVHMSRLILLVVLCSGVLASPVWAGVPEDYAKFCANCHGKDGKGQTTMGAKLKIKDLTDPKVQAEFTDEQAFKDITDGRTDAKTGKVLMPPRKDKLSPDQIKQLVGLVRTFKAK